MTTVLITGGFGYLGGRLADRLAGPSRRLILASRTQATAPVWLSGAHVRTGRLDEPRDLATLCADVDVVIHLAGLSAAECAANPALAHDVNVLATGRLVDAAARSGVKRFVFVSTAHVYGRALTGHVTEMTPPEPSHPYGASKLAAEDLVLSATSLGPMRGVVARLSNAFGAPMDVSVPCWSLLVNDLSRQAMTTGRSVLGTTGVQRRDFVPMADACRALDHLVSSAENAVGGEVFNIGGRWAPTVWDMAQRVAARAELLLGRPVEVARPAPTGDTAVAPLDFDTTKLDATGFEPPPGRIEDRANTEIDRLLNLCLTLQA